MDNEAVKDKKVYILLSRSTTGISKAIKNISKATYTHSSISFHRDLRVMYSFARRRIHNPLIAGFVYEYLDKGILADNAASPCVLYELEVTRQAYDALKEEIASFISNYKKHKYNIAGMWAIQHNKALERKYKYVCSQFVAHVLVKSGALESLPKSEWLIKPDDFSALPQLKELYRGELRGATAGADAIDDNEEEL